MEPFIASGGYWWRFSRYEIRDGVIRPAKEAQLLQYDVWKSYEVTLTRKEQDRRPPHLVLANLIRQLPLDVMPTDDDILSFCQQYGLLGVLPHTAISIVLRPRWERNPETQKIVPTQRQFHRVGAAHWAMPISRRILAETDNPERLDRIVDEHEGVEQWPQPGVLLADLRRGTTEHHDLDKVLGSFFPDVEDGRYPVPLSDAFWRNYGESKTTFVYAARLLADALAGLERDHAKGGQSQSHVRLRWALNRLNILASATSAVSYAGKDMVPSFKWSAPSLLGHLALMTIMDITVEGKSVRRCPCGELFIASAHQMRYHNEQCRWRYQKRSQNAGRRANMKRIKRAKGTNRRHW